MEVSIVGAPRGALATQCEPDSAPAGSAWPASGDLGAPPHPTPQVLGEMGIRCRQLNFSSDLSLNKQ